MAPRLLAPPLSLYVHIPWCVRKCPYCDFNSHAAPTRLPQAQYVRALLEDLEHDLPRAGGRELVSVFFGGGTPSLFEPDWVGELLRGVRERIACAPDLEVTLEANPGTLERGRFAAYRQAGVNRVSLGAQSFDEGHLRVLGRIHGRGDIERAAEELHAAGIENFNLDLMYGLPGQTPAQALADLEAALVLGPAHISHYQLTLEPGTVFYHRPPSLPTDDEVWDMQLACQERLARHGYQQYEVSAYARPGRRCRHNLNYWRFGDYLGIGAGAHGKLSDPRSSTVLRTARCRQPRTYLTRSAALRVVESRLVAPEELPFEYMLNALRLLDGFELEHFTAHTGLAADVLGGALAAACRRGLLAEKTPGTWAPTELGRRFLNDLQALFLPDADVCRQNAYVSITASS